MTGNLTLGRNVLCRGTGGCNTSTHGNLLTKTVMACALLLEKQEDAREERADSTTPTEPAPPPTMRSYNDGETEAIIRRAEAEVRFYRTIAAKHVDELKSRERVIKELKESRGAFIMQLQATRVALKTRRKQHKNGTRSKQGNSRYAQRRNAEPRPACKPQAEWPPPRNGSPQSSQKFSKRLTLRPKKRYHICNLARRVVA